MNRRTAIIAYDISSDRKRRVALRVLARWRLDGQRSVHECRLDHEEATKLYLQLVELLEPTSDRLLLTWSNADRPAVALGLAARRQRGPLRTHA